jgi:predicted transcriptional regulator
MPAQRKSRKWPEGTRRTFVALDPETVEVLERMVAEREQTKRVIINKAIRAFAKQTGVTQ